MRSYARYEYATICERPDIDRQDQAVELRAHAADLERQQRTIMHLLAAGRLATTAPTENSEADEAPLIRPAMFFADAVPAPTANAHSAADDDCLVMPRMTF